jgi:hypothetical protein
VNSNKHENSWYNNVVSQHFSVKWDCTRTRTASVSANGETVKNGNCIKTLAKKARRFQNSAIGAVSRNGLHILTPNMVSFFQHMIPFCPSEGLLALS